jgi:hypothetical protein
MEIKVLTSRKSDKQELVEIIAKFYAKRLNLLKSKYKVFIVFDPLLSKKDGANGLCCKTGEHEITIALSGTLKTMSLYNTLAHEMVHVKQICRGHYRSEILRNGRVAHYWMGQRVKAEYIDRPWEREAFMREGLLCRYLSNEVVKQEKKGRKYV